MCYVVIGQWSRSRSLCLYVTECGEKHFETTREWLHSIPFPWIMFWNKFPMNRNPILNSFIFTGEYNFSQIPLIQIRWIEINHSSVCRPCQPVFYFTTNSRECTAETPSNFSAFVMLVNSSKRVKFSITIVTICLSVAVTRKFCNINQDTSRTSHRLCTIWFFFTEM